jgi:hypothetical protein
MVLASTLYSKFSVLVDHNPELCVNGVIAAGIVAGTAAATEAGGAAGGDVAAAGATTVAASDG